MGKMRLCEKCGRSLTETTDGWICPKGHEVGQNGVNAAQLQRDKETGLAYQAGAFVFTGQSKGRKRKKPAKKSDSLFNLYCCT